MQIDKMNPGLLRALLAVADHGSISAASAALHYSQPGLSRKLARLERAAGAELLRRTPRGTTLTAGGERLARVARTVVDDLSGLAAPPPGRGAPLRLGVFPTACMDVVPRAVATLAHTVPDLDVRLVATPDPASALLLDDVDLAVVVGWDAPALDPADVTVTRIRDEDLVVILPAGDERRGLTVDDGDLADERWVDGPHPDCLGRGLGLWPGARIAFEAPTWAAKVRAVADGRGLSLVPRGVSSTLPASVGAAELRRGRPRSVHLARPVRGGPDGRDGREHPHADALAEALVGVGLADASGW
jgi:DNA-binding transcriptional LysR family regulator